MELFYLKFSTIVKENNVCLLQVWQINMWIKLRFRQWLDGINRCSNKEAILIYISTYISQAFKP